MYRQELRPVLQEDAEVMDCLFGSVNVDLVEQRQRASKIGLPVVQGLISKYRRAA